MQGVERLTHLAARSLLAIMLVLIIVFGLALLVLRYQGNQLLSVQTASMVPTFHPGDALIVEPVRSPELRPGEIISYRNPKAPDMIVSHRLVSINNQNGQLTTAGDALHSQDPPFNASLLVGRVRAVAPDLGSTIEFLRQPTGLAVTVYLPAIIIAGYQCYAALKYYRRPRYRHLSYR